LQKPLSDFKPLGMWGCALGPFKASALMATSPRKEERKKERTTALQSIIIKSILC